MYFTADVRLVGSINSVLEGAVEIHSSGGWSKVCDDGSWDDVDSSVLCRTLGFSSKGAFHKSMVQKQSSGQTPRFLGNISCNGSEDTLTKCLSGNESSTRCPQRKFIMITCEAGACDRFCCYLIISDS